MLYDPKWEKKTKADPFSLESLIAWLEKQPPEQTYEFCEWNNCLLAQWLRSSDPHARVSNVDGFSYHVLGQIVNLRPMRDIALGNDIDDQAGQTFGAALSRARTASHSD